MKFILYIVLFIFLSPAFAKKFSTDYVSFDLLNHWHCYPEGNEWICSNKLNQKKASEAMIILTAKQKGPMDSLSQYMAHLKRTRSIKGSSGKKSVQSKVFHTKQRAINGHMWVDGFHGSSEVPVFYTRYLVTIKEGLAVLVTYSAHKNHYKKYAADFARSINSLRLKNIKWGAGSGGSFGVGSAEDDIFGGIGTDEDGEAAGDGDFGGQKGIMNLLKKNWPILSLLLLAAVLYFILKRRRKPKQRDREKHHRHKRHSSRRSSRRH